VEAVKAIILPTMSEAKRQGWSPFFPICEACGRISTTRVTDYHPDRNELGYACDRAEERVPSCGHKATTTIFNGKVKVGWKVDWALRWYSYDIAYEMYGKDLIDSAKLSGKIIRLMGKQPPTGYFYELFLDEEGRKISKSVGKGLTIDAWTSYAPLESLLYFIFQNPKQAKRLFWGVVPKSVDDYLSGLANYSKIDAAKQPDAPVWHIFDKGQRIPPYTSVITFSLINNLISAVGTDDADLIMEYLRRYDPHIGDHVAVIEDLIQKGMHYYRDHILPHKQFRAPTDKEHRLLLTLKERLLAYAGDDENELQTIPFDVARSFDVAPKALFKTFYEVILGQDRGPRFGTFIRLVGKQRVLSLMARALENT
jgi:lysyl-tRNA synthetase class 1